MKLDLHDLAIEFVRQHKFSMPIQDVERAMEIGAEEMAKVSIEMVKEARIELEIARRKSNTPQ